MGWYSAAYSPSNKATGGPSDGRSTATSSIPCHPRRRSGVVGSRCFRSKEGAERFAVLAATSSTRKNDVTAIDALVRLFNGHPWMPPQPA